jgi:selenide, water dikinase
MTTREISAARNTGSDPDFPKPTPAVPNSEIGKSGSDPTFRLTKLSHGGGCGCKIAPGVLAQILGETAPKLVPPGLLVGIETSDDAAVYRLNERQAIVATTDFFTPIVDDPFDFGAIAATNAISDVYAMSATPLFALAIVGMPVDTLPLATIRRILEGGEAACARAGIPVAGGHTIDSVEPIYGLVVIGSVDPAHLKRNADARAGDAIVLGKPLGVGIYSAALRRDALTPARYATLLGTTTELNTPGIALGAREDVHALTDVTGFGLLGHLLEMCRGADLRARLRLCDVPTLPGALDLAREGFVTGASKRNLESYGGDVKFARVIDAAERALLTDPQTSGGLLVACAPDAVDAVLATFAREGFAHAAAIGTFARGSAGIDVD